MNPIADGPAVDRPPPDAARTRDRRTLETLTRALDGQIALEAAADEVIGPDFRGDMDRIVRGMRVTPAGWMAWWRFLWLTGEVVHLGCEHLETIEHPDGRYTLVGRWMGLRDGQEVRSEPIEATYRLTDGRLSAVYSSRTNYTFFVPEMATRRGALRTLLRFRRWRGSPAAALAVDAPIAPRLTDAELAPIRLLGEVLAGHRPLRDVAAAFAPSVIMHADRYIMRGSAAGWIRWVAFMRRHGRVRELTGAFDGFRRAADGTILGSGRFAGFVDGQPVRSAPASARYRVVDGRIAEIWSVRSNYTFMFGDGFATPLGFWRTIARFGLTSFTGRQP